MLPNNFWLLYYVQTKMLNVFIRFNFIIAGVFYWGFSHSMIFCQRVPATYLLSLNGAGWLFFFCFFFCGMQLEQRHIFYGNFQMYRWKSVIREINRLQDMYHLNGFDDFMRCTEFFVWINWKIMEMLLMRKIAQ